MKSGLFGFLNNFVFILVPMKCPLIFLCAFFPLITIAQSREEIFDFQFHPTKKGGYYYVETEKKDSLWYRQAWFIAQKTLYMEGTYKDETCKIGQGEFKWYHPNGYLKARTSYVNGLKEGVFLGYDEQGRLKDSLNYHKDYRIGIGYSIHANGYMADSTQFDGKGNGVEVRWYDDGSPSSAGYWMQDTLKKGTWKYFHKNGQVKAIEKYDSIGKLIVCNCFDEKSLPLDTSLCREREATVEARVWKRFLEKNLKSLVEQKAKEGLKGNFTVVVRFIVDIDGSVKDIVALTNYGYGIEEAVVSVFNKAPAWTPGRMFGQNVKSYHTQPVTFVISEQ